MNKVSITLLLSFLVLPLSVFADYHTVTLQNYTSVPIQVNYTVCQDSSCITPRISGWTFLGEIHSQTAKQPIYIPGNQYYSVTKVINLITDKTIFVSYPAGAANQCNTAKVGVGNSMLLFQPENSQQLNCIMVAK